MNLSDSENYHDSSLASFTLSSSDNFETDFDSDFDSDSNSDFDSDSNSDSNSDSDSDSDFDSDSNSDSDSDSDSDFDSNSDFDSDSDSDSDFKKRFNKSNKIKKYYYFSNGSNNEEDEEEDDNMNFVTDNIKTLKIKNKEGNTYMLRIKNLFDERNLKQLYVLNDTIKNSKTLELKKTIQKEIDKAIHLIGKELIEKHELNNIEIVQFISYDIKNFSDDYQKQKQYAALISYIDIDNITDEFCEAFNFSNINYKKLLQLNYKLFVSSLVKKATKLSHFKNLYKIFGIKKNYIYSQHHNQLVLQMIDHLKTRDVKKNNLSVEQLSEIITPLFVMISKHKNNYQKDLIEYIQNNFDKKESVGIFILILNDSKENLGKDIIDEISTLIEELIKEEVRIFLDYFNNNNKIKFFLLSKLNERIALKIGVLDGGLSNYLETLKLLKNNYFKQINESENQNEKRKSNSIRVENSAKNNLSLSSIIDIDEIIDISYEGLLAIFNTFYKYVKSITGRYIKNENKIRISSTYKIEEYFEMKELLEDNAKTEFDKYYLDIIFKYICPMESSKYLKIIYEDYIFSYLSRFHIVCTKESISFFDALYQLFILNHTNRNGMMTEEDQPPFSLSMERFSKFMLYIESYSEYIIFLYKFLIFISSHIDNFYQTFLTLILSKKFKFEQIVNSNKYCINRDCCYVNDIPYNLFESILYCILMMNPIFQIRSLQEDYLLLSEIKTFSDAVMKIDEKLNLHLNQKVYLNHFLKISEYFRKNNVPLRKNIQKYFVILKNENKMLTLNEKDLEIGLVKEEYYFLRDKLSGMEGFPDLMIQLLNEKIKVCRNDQCMEEAIDILCSDDVLLSKSKIIFENYFSNFQLSPRIIKEIESSSDTFDHQEYCFENANEMDKETGVSFLSQFENRTYNSVIKILNSKSNDYLDDILMNIFDKGFASYYEMKKESYDLSNNENEISSITEETISKNLVEHQSLKIFNKCILFIHKEEYQITENNKLGMLYCLSFIKYYCYHLCYYIYNYSKDKAFNEFIEDEIFNKTGISDAFKNVIKIYILKVLNISFIGNYNTFINFLKEKQLFIQDFDFNEDAKSSLSYPFLQNNTIDDYMDLSEMYTFMKNNNYASTDEMISVITKNLKEEEYKEYKKRFLIFYDLIVNEELSKIKKNFNLDHYKKLSPWLFEIIDKLKLSNPSQRIFSFYFDCNSPQFYHLLINEMILYSNKFALICSFAKPNSIFSKYISPQVKEHLKNLYIPGEDSNDAVIIKTGKEISDFLQIGNRGAYLCSCNHWYTIANCTYPNQTSKCSFCGQLIGGENHSLIKRAGHVRVYLNPSEYMPYSVPHIFLNDLMARVEEEMKKQFKGFKRVLRNFLIDSTRKVRNLNYITYLILIFIFYSCIYFLEISGILSPKEMEDFYYLDANDDPKYRSILPILTDIWEILSMELKKLNISNIACFLNSILPELSELIINHDNIFENPKERADFELLCNNIIENAISNYENTCKIYVDNNNKILHNQENTLKSIFEETSNINRLPPKIYPLIKFFKVIDYPTVEKFNEYFKSLPNRNEIYPVVTSYLNGVNTTAEENPMEFLKSFKLINPLINYTLTKYNNKLSRTEAKNISIESELYRDQKMKILFNDFKKGWGKVYDKFTNYDCHDILPPKMITERDRLAYLLNDNFEDDYGKYIASFYKDIITKQNKFLEPLLRNDSDLNQGFSRQINRKKIIVQRADPNEIVSLKIQSPLFKSLRDIIYTYSTRNSHIESENPKYSNNRTIQFNVEAIESELRKLLSLNKKKLFENEKEQDFIHYSLEEFTNIATIISSYKEQCHEHELLSDSEMQGITPTLEKTDYEIIINSLQSLMLYFTDKRNITGDENLLNEVMKLPKEIITLHNEFIHIVHSSPWKNIKLKKMISLYEYVEEFYSEIIIQEVPRHTTWDQKELKETNQHINAYAELEPEQIVKLNKHFNQENLLVTREDFRLAVRKFICRFLISEQFKHFNWPLLDYLRYQEELWKYGKESESKFEEEMDQLYDIYIMVEQALDLYKILGMEKK